MLRKPRPMRAGHGRPLCAGTSDDGRPFVLSKGYDGMPRPTTADRLCCQRAKMACHARRRPTVYAVKGRRWHATPDVVRPCVLQKGEDGMPRQTPFDRVCCPKAYFAVHARSAQAFADAAWPRTCCVRRPICPLTSNLALIIAPDIPKTSYSDMSLVP